jgi:hypothetical protein
VSDFTLMNTKHPSALRPAFTVAAFLVLTWLTALVARAQEGTGTINGRVINKATGEYLRNAGVAVVGSNISTTAGPGGSFTVSGVPAGDVKIVITYAGLDALEETVNVPAGQTVTREFGLTSASYSDQVIELGAFRVSTAREGNAKAIMEQRVAINMKKVIAADAIGNVSEGNVGEFLKLMPGVVMDYVEADTRNLRLRGLPPKYNAVLLDGMSIANAASAAIGTGRAFEFEQLSISAVETVELTKVPTPDQPSNVAGTVNLRTKSAFDRQGRRIEWTAGIAANSYYVDFKRTEGWNDEAQFKLLPNFSNTPISCSTAASVSPWAWSAITRSPRRSTSGFSTMRMTRRTSPTTIRSSPRSTAFGIRTARSRPFVRTRTSASTISGRIISPRGFTSATTTTTRVSITAV